MAGDRQLVVGVSPDPTQEQVNSREPGDLVHKLHAPDRFGGELPPLNVCHLRILTTEVIEGSQEESRRSACGVAHDFAELRIDALDHCLGEWSRSEVLTSPAFRVAGVLLEQAFVCVAL